MTELRTAKDFHDFFKAIPVWRWTTGRAENRFGQRCAVGHVWAEFGGNGWNHTKENLDRILARLTPYECAHDARADLINDFGIIWKFDGTTYWPTKVYKQWTSKGRILAALEDVIKGKRSATSGDYLQLAKSDHK